MRRKEWSTAVHWHVRVHVCACACGQVHVRVACAISHTKSGVKSIMLQLQPLNPNISFASSIAFQLSMYVNSEPKVNTCVL